jgi:glutathione S-transferase
MTMMRVLGRGTSGNVQKVVWLLEELKHPYRREDYGRQFNNTQTEDYLRLNPSGKVPTLVDGDAVVWESNTILRYLGGKLAGGAALYPGDPAARSQIERWMDWQLASFNAPYLGVFREAKKKEEERAASFAADAKELTAQLELLEKGTAGRPWIAGANFSIADICLGPVIDRALAFPVSFPALPGVRAWRDKVVAREAYQRSKG